jgi:hypothetical protein
MKKARREAIVMAYVLATKGVLPTDLERLLADMDQLGAPGVTEDEARKALKETLRESRRQDRALDGRY